jgi:hypothetical protein
MGKPWAFHGVYDKMIQNGEKTWKLQRNLENMRKLFQSLGF